MTQDTWYNWSCDTKTCDVETGPIKEQLSDQIGWSSLYVSHTDYAKRSTLHFCPKCTEAIRATFPGA